MNAIKLFFRISLILLLPLAVAASTYVVLSNALLDPYDKSSKEDVIVEIPPGSSFNQIAKDLEQKRILRHSWSLTMLARFKKQDTSVQAGEYELSPSMTPKEILAKLVSGKMLVRQVEVREGLTIQNIGKIVQDAGLVSKEEFFKAARDAVLLAKAGLAAQSFEGYLFPETYNFSRPITAEQIVWTMFTEAEKNWPAEYQNLADNLNLSRHEIIILASIIEKESGNVEEQPLVSSVFHNRLKLGMKLQSDPTVIYGIKDFNGDLTKADLLNPHPYNTYVNHGLPPGPISNPGKSAISAALHPAQSTYLYFVGDNRGNHIFSSNLNDHNAAVNKYQKQGYGRQEEESKETPTPQPSLTPTKQP